MCILKQECLSGLANHITGPGLQVLPEDNISTVVLLLSTYSQRHLELKTETYLTQHCSRYKGRSTKLQHSRAAPFLQEKGALAAAFQCSFGGYQVGRHDDASVDQDNSQLPHKFEKRKSDRNFPSSFPASFCARRPPTAHNPLHFLHAPVTWGRLIMVYNHRRQKMLY